MPAGPPPFELTMAREAFATAAEMHGRATREGAAQLGPEQLAAMRRHHEAYATALREGRVRDAIAADNAFHDVLVDAAGDPDVRVSVDLLAPRLARLDLWFFTRKAFQDPPSSHPEIVAALERGDAETAAGLVEESFLGAGAALAEALGRSGGR